MSLESATRSPPFEIVLDLENPPTQSLDSDRAHCSTVDDVACPW